MFTPFLGLPLLVWYIFACEALVIVIAVFIALLQLKQWTKPGTIAATFYMANGDMYQARVRALESEGGIETFRWGGHTYIVPQIDDRYSKMERYKVNHKNKNKGKENNKNVTNAVATSTVVVTDAEGKETALPKPVQYRPIYRERINAFITVPHAVYIEGRGDPVDMLDMGKSGLPVELLDILGSNHIVSDTFAEFGKQILSPILIAVVLGAVVLLTGFGVYQFTAKKVDEVKTHIEALSTFGDGFTDNNPVGTR